MPGRETGLALQALPGSLSGSLSQRERWILLCARLSWVCWSDRQELRPTPDPTRPAPRCSQSDREAPWAGPGWTALGEEHLGEVLGQPRWKEKAS